MFVADTSAWARAGRPGLRREWERALERDQIVSCPIVQLELLYSSRDAESFDAIAAGLAGIREAPVNRSVTRAATAAYRELAHRSPLFHRSVRLPDLLVAAAAADAGLGVLHYDADYDTLAEVLRFESRWLAPRGSLD